MNVRFWLRLQPVDATLYLYNKKMECRKWLRKARLEGVELYGFNCKVTASAISINRQIDVVLTD